MYCDILKEVGLDNYVIIIFSILLDVKVNVFLGISDLFFFSFIVSVKGYLVIWCEYLGNNF